MSQDTHPMAHWRPEFARSEMASIRFHPYATGDFITVGVALYGLDNGFHRARVADATALQHLRCLSSGHWDVRWVASTAATVASRIGTCVEDLRDAVRTRMFSIGDIARMPAEADARLLNELFDAFVHLPSSSPRRRPFEPRSRAEVREAVFKELRRLMGLRADQIIRSEPLPVDPGGRSEHLAEIDILDDRHVGAILSAWYASVDSIETHFLRGYFDVQCVAAARRLRGGLFVLRPPRYRSVEPDNVRRIEMLLGEELWKARRGGLHVAMETNEDDLARRVLSWTDS